MNPTDDPLVQAQTLITDLRHDIAADLDGFLIEVHQFCQRLEAAGGTISREDLWRQLRRGVLTICDQRLALPVTTSEWAEAIPEGVKTTKGGLVIP